jgi:NAD(P)-dependent dehydrogenase (short-subunit alcohol dehydrogenase family)
MNFSGRVALITGGTRGIGRAIARRLSNADARIAILARDPERLEVHLLAGRPNNAVEVARRALDLAQRQKERGNEAWVLRLFGEIAAQADPPELAAADAHYHQALARADELGMRPLVAHCHFGLGKLYRRIGKREEAHEHLTTATTMYREMDMGFWLERAEAELKEPPV